MSAIVTATATVVTTADANTIVAAIVGVAMTTGSVTAVVIVVVATTIGAAVVAVAMTIGVAIVTPTRSRVMAGAAATLRKNGMSGIGRTASLRSIGTTTIVGRTRTAIEAAGAAVVAGRRLLHRQAPLAPPQVLKAKGRREKADPIQNLSGCSAART